MLNAQNHNRLIAGLVDNGVEFFVNNNEVHCTNSGKIYAYKDFPKWIIEIIEEDMLKYPEALKALSSWENLHESDYVRQYIYCRFGGQDADADINTDGQIHYSEYFDCGLRGKCKYEGKLCCSIQVHNGYLTKTELEVLKNIQLQDKLIADKLCISTETVLTHQQNIRSKTGCKSKVELAVFAAKKGII